MTRIDFENLVHQLSHKLYGFAFHILHNQEEAEDAVQEVFVKLWKMGEKIDEYCSKDALAITMTKNYCIDQIRRQRHIQTESHDDKYQLNISPPTPFEQMEIKESGIIIKSIIDSLPETYRSIIIMKEIEDFTYEEIAEKMDQNINTLRVTLSRARKLIREEYNKYLNERR